MRYCWHASRSSTPNTSSSGPMMFILSTTPSGSFQDAWIALCAQVARRTRYAAFEHIPILNEATVMHAVAGGRACADDISRTQLDTGRQVLDQTGDREDHVGGLLVLHDSAVELQGQAQFLRVACEGGRHQVRTHGQKARRSFAHREVHAQLR